MRTGFTNCGYDLGDHVSIVSRGIQFVKKTTSLQSLWLVDCHVLIVYNLLIDLLDCDLGKVVCSSCSNSKAPLKYLDYKVDREWITN